MGKTLKYAKDFDFPEEFGFSTSAGKIKVSGYCRGGKAKMAEGGEVKRAVHKHEKAMHPGKPLTNFAKGGKK